MSYVHDLTPFALQFTETFGIRWYGLAYLSGFVSGYFTLITLARRGGSLLKEQSISDFITYVAVGVLAGGRLGYCLFYAPELFTSFDGHFPYWGVLKVNEGGMASHGGILGVMLVCYVYARVHKVAVLHCMDLVVLGGSVGFFFGRIANFINGELYGRAAPETFRWAVKFPQELTLWAQKEPSQLLSVGPAVEALKELKLSSGEIVPLNISLWQQWVGGFSHDMISRQRVYEVIESLIQAVQRGQMEVTSALGPVLTPRYPSQLIQAVLEGLLVFLILTWLWRRPQKPGVIGGWFGFLYCVARIIGEQFRMPDAQLGFQLLGLTRGQWLSFGLLAVAVVWLILCYRRPVPRMGGWNPDFYLHRK